MNMTQLINLSFEYDMIKGELEQQQSLRLPVANQLLSTRKKLEIKTNNNYKKHGFNLCKLEKQNAKENTIIK